MPEPRVAIIHDWLVSMRGGEKVLEVILDLFPKAEIFTLVHHPGNISRKINSHKIHCSFLQRLPFARKLYRHYLMFHPAAIESFDLGDFDVVISLSHCVAKGVQVSPESVHLSYMFTPMRYAYDMFFEYFDYKRFRLCKKIFYSLVFNNLRTWDYVSSQRVDKIITISEFVNKRIKRNYNLKGEVLYPPVDTDYFKPEPGVEKEDFYLMVSALVPYKRVDLAIRAFNRIPKNLVVIGVGPEETRLKRLVKNNNIKFLGFLPDQEVLEYYRKAKGFVFPGKEDFGLTMVEANACGTPVIAYNRGGAAEIITDRENGILFNEPEPDSLLRAVTRFEKATWDRNVIRRSSLKFSELEFKKQFIKKLNQLKADEKTEKE